jgi:hypothetical protein
MKSWGGSVEKRYAKMGVSVWLLIFVTFASVAQETETDSIQTPFRKGRWLTGLDGSISSTSTKIDTTQLRAFGNQYAFDFSTGKFFKDRWLLGGVVRMQRESSRQFVDLESEQLLVAPILSYYLSANSQGSVFFSIAPGYARFREKTVFLVAGTPSQEILTGGGFGLFAQLGYSYVLGDRVVFDLGLALNNTWVSATREIDGGRSTNKADIHVGTVLFSFGFNVILDEFFF